MSKRKNAAPAPTARPKATPTLGVRTGPNLSGGEATFNPVREGAVLAAIRNGDGGGTTDGIVSFLAGKFGKFRVPTVTYFAKEASAGGSIGKTPLVETVRVGKETYFLPLATDRKASAAGRKVRALVLALRDAGKATKPKRERKARKASSSPVEASAPTEAEEVAAE